MTTTPVRAGVEQRERRRLVAARVLVGVVADDRAVRDGPVDAAVDPREPGGDLVDGPVQVVDPALQRDGELDEVLAAAAEQHPLRVAHAPHLDHSAHQASPSADRAHRQTPASATTSAVVGETCTTPRLAV